MIPSIASYGYQFEEARILASLVELDGKAKYTPRSLQLFFASTALANGVPIHEVSRWLGHCSVKTAADIHGHLLPGACERCLEVLQRSIRPAPPDVMSLPSEEASSSAGNRAV
ncbi:integrase [Streptomyces avidinii]|uniref:Integrase n=1 Tax=Streptomyces avidinii TaxID=1895 RepID=A0ABS4LDK7_STRAV|nr:integrase [Streptomyces avidinii]MBP2040126.1 integrase [Streptomyces avidinii]GGZ17981.1 hypothetical protein GCM10010343_51420 [Streptomyces avidinii]